MRHGAWRSSFSASSVFAREAFLDEVANLRGTDPLALRLDLLKEPETFKAGSLTIDRGRLRRVLEVVREKSGWGAPVTARHGRGVACNIYNGETCIAYVVDVAVEGRVGPPLVGAGLEDLVDLDADPQVVRLEELDRPAAVGEVRLHHLRILLHKDHPSLGQHSALP